MLRIRIVLWLQLEAVQGAIDDADTDEIGIGHPMLDRVAECSANPTEATAFFVDIFWRVSEDRLASLARLHPYIKEVFNNLEASAPNKGGPAPRAWRQPGR